MTYREAIAELKNTGYKASAFSDFVSYYEDDPDYKEAVDTVEKAAEILTPKRPLPDDRYYGNGMCPNCKAVFMDKDTNYCGNCGQALNWGGTEVRTE